MQTRRADGAKSTSATSDAPGAGALRVQRIDDPAALSAHLGAWETLAREAIEPNVFHEHWMLLPALRAFDGDRKASVALVLSGEELVGVVPLVRETLFPGLTTLRVWEHEQSPLAMPLFHRDHARAAVARLFEWAATEEKASLFALPSFSGDGAFSHALVDVAQTHPSIAAVTEEHTRAIFRPRASADEYITAALGSSTRRTLRKQERKLGELGTVTYDEARSPDEVARWVDDFLALESSGWKGERGTAFASTASGTTYFREVAAGAAQRGRFSGLTLSVNGRPLAMRCALRAGEGAFGYKSAYDESTAKLSPGVHLELHAIERMHADPSLRWLDSCSIAQSPLYNRVFLDRHTIRSLLVGLTPRGNTVTALYPAARLAKRLLRR